MLSLFADRDLREIEIEEDLIVEVTDVAVLAVAVIEMTEVLAVIEAKEADSVLLAVRITTMKTATMVLILIMSSPLRVDNKKTVRVITGGFYFPKIDIIYEG